MGTGIRAAIAILLFLALGGLFAAAACAAGRTLHGVPNGAVLLSTHGATRAGGKPNHSGAHKKRHRPPAPVSLRVTVGYGGQYRASAWTPVRVTVHNRTAALISATVSADDKNVTRFGPPATFRTVYEAPVILPAGSTKQVTLYLPGSDIQDAVDVSVRDGDRTLAGATGYGSDFGASAVSTGILVDDPANSRWLENGNPSSSGAERLTPATLDPYPEALASFDLILLSNADASRLDHDQIGALEQYVRNGGSLVLVGGPDWQETLKPLPSGLLPGRLVGTRTVPDLRGLLSVDPITMPRANQTTTISVLSHPRGTVLASERGVPLVVRSALGKGLITYLAFDPSVAPVPRWIAVDDLLKRLLTLAAPRAMDRVAYPYGYQPPPPFFGPFGPSFMSQELSNVPAAALPSLLLFIALAVVYILLLGPANFLVLRRWGRREWSWITIPALAALCVGSTFAIAYRLKGDTVLINSVGIVQLDGSDEQRPITLYTGLFAPLRGDYRLTYQGPAFASGLQTAFYYTGPGSFPSSDPLTLRFRQGSQTDISFLSMNMWSMRDVKLETTADVPGSIRSDLAVDARGYLVGSIHNGTRLDLLRPAVLAGRAVAHLPDLPAGGTVRVRIRPAGNLFDQTPLWFKLYGGPNLLGRIYYAKGLFYRGPGIFPGSILSSEGSSLPEEHGLSDRIRNVASTLPDTATALSAGEVQLVAWSEQPLGSLTVDGVAPQRRDLNLVTSPLAVHVSRGTFRLRQGTLGARLVDIDATQSTACCPGYPGSQPIYLGVGGSATFEFDIPYAGHVHFQQLTLSVNAGGADGTDIGHVYDWQARRWTPVNLVTGDATLSHPDRFISPWGTLLVKLKATGDYPSTYGPTSGEITITDPYQDLQLSGSGVAA